ncbi:uncharacterized protein N7483_000778 [Penicillium malachiteum]|uniref:uncharacterized protein n=1 Tax=Penicillium malachiteum TaxID=1324776 RepID=UPI0025491949|nr:uncharacterized protein N7483_000778 [Penicillium malachiteum]KAJ5735653.1 hypothetical protein N7483_000778 [Penicillium malachiteum]
MPHRLYESRREWFCHLQNEHSISGGAAENMSCPLCLSSVSSGKELERHIGRHLEELALFALPRSEEDDNEPRNSSNENSDEDELIESNMIKEPEQRPADREALGENEDEHDYDEPDVIALRHRATIYPLHYCAYSIDDGDLTVGQLRIDAAKLLKVESPDSIRLLYKGNLLRDDKQSCKAARLKQHSEVLCVVSEVKVDTTRIVGSDDSSDDAPRAPFQSKDKRKVRTSQSPPGEDETQLPPTHPSRHTSPTRAPNARTPLPPNLKVLRTLMEQVSALTIYLRRDMTPLCEEFRSNPLSDIGKRDFEYRRLSETILAQVMLKADGIEPDSDPIVRNARKILIKEAQAHLNMLEEVPRKRIGS